jgi:hypothetical protein
LRFRFGLDVLAGKHVGHPGNCPAPGHVFVQASDRDIAKGFWQACDASIHYRPAALCEYLGDCGAQVEHVVSGLIAISNWSHCVRCKFHDRADRHDVTSLEAPVNHTF